MIFKEFIRTNTNPATYHDDRFAFYNRSAWPAVANIRDKLNDWMQNYPEADRAALALRFQKEFDSAFFELVIFTLYKRLGFELQPHPEIPGSAKRCDFLVTSPAASFYLECISTDGKSAEEIAIENSINLIYDRMNTINCPNFFIRIVDIQLKTKVSPAIRRIMQFLEDQINTIDPDSIPAGVIKEFAGLPAFVHNDPHFFLSIEIIPKSVEGRSRPMRSVGVFPIETRIGGNEAILIAAIKKKATKYGKPDLPFMIAINSTNQWGTDEYDIDNALYGDIFAEYVPAMLKLEKPIQQTKPCAFFANGRPIHTRVSAVFVTNVNVSNLGVAKYWIYYHPYAKNRLQLDHLNEHRITKEGIFVADGKPLKELLDIPDNWPGEKIVS